MTTYDRGQVPILDFHNPAGATFHYDGCGVYSYPMGNTRKRSITAQIGTTKQQHLELLLLGCGDIRNLLCTVSELSQRKPQHRPKSVDFHLNDYDALILPRDVILLDIVSDINPDSADDVDFLWNVWNNMCLCESHYQRLKQVIKSLLDSNFEDKGCMIQFQDSNTEQECRAVWEDWLNLHLDVQKVKQERTKFNKDQLFHANFAETSTHILSKLALAICSQNGLRYLRESSSLNEEVKHWACEASTTDDEDHVNPTLIRPFVHNWKINNYGSPFEGYMPFTIPDIERCKSLTGVCKETLTLWVKNFRQFKHLNPIKVILWSGDGLGLCTSGFPSELQFDVIDTSNVSDHIGLLNVLVCCAPKLKRPGESLLLTSSMLCWAAKCKDMEDYYNKCIGIDTNMLPTILGLHLAVDLDLGNRMIPDDWEEPLYWIKSSTRRTKLTIDKESDVITALWNLTKRCFKLVVDLETPQHCGCGAYLSSPLTLLRIIHQMHPLIEGGASRIMELLESQLRYDFYQEHEFSWKLLKSIATRDNEPVVQVTVPVNLQYTEFNESKRRARSTPMVVFRRNNEFPKISWLSGIDGCPVLYNSIRFNVQEGKVTFHMLKEDWENARKTLWLSVIRDKKYTGFKHRPICLKNDNQLFNVQEVDPEETFGLFAVQEFEVCDSSSPLLQLIKVEEECESYHAEFAILDTEKCNAKDMVVESLPESHSTQIKLNFRGENGSTIYLSCPVNTSSRFQLYKKKAKLVCEIKKKKHCVTGEMVLVNPAQVPFHVMQSSWDPEEDDIIWALGKMFRDERTRVAKREFVPPFYEVIRCIVTIFLVLIKEKRPIIWGLNLDKDRNPTNTLVVKVFNKVYKWNNLPYVKCIIYDSKEFGYTDPLEFGNCMQRGLFLEKEELEMLRRILHINAARTEQDNKRTSNWTDSFISPLYPRETDVFSLDNPFDAMKKELEQMLGNGTARENPFNAMMKEVEQLIGNNEDIRDNVLDAMVKEFEHVFGNWNARDNSPHCEAPIKSSDKPDSCAVCRKSSTYLKRCTECKEMTCCNGVCQNQHREQKHKDSLAASSKQPQNQP